jgi:amino acid adenylation domain-containing protein
MLEGEKMSNSQNEKILTYMPLSFSQERLWFLDQLEKGSTAYNELFAFKINRNLKVAVFKKVLQEIIARHEILRTNFDLMDDLPAQIIHPKAEIEVPMIDLQNFTKTEQTEEIQRLARLTTQRVFDLKKDTLLRISLLQLAKASFVIFLNFHHIIFDGWSLRIFMEELISLYLAFLEGKISPLNELAIQYADFAYWQREWFKEDRMQKQIAYWQKQLAGAPSLLEIPTDSPRPAIQSFSGSHFKIKLNSNLTRKLKELSKKQDVTLFMLLEAAFATLLFRYTNQEDLLIGTPIANRNYPEIEHLIGFFINTLIIRHAFKDNFKFVEILKQVKKSAIEAYTNQDAPFEKVIETIKTERQLTYNPLFQVMFVLQNIPLDLEKAKLLDITLQEVETGISKFDLTLSMIELENVLEGIWEYNTDLFKPDTIQRMAGHFQTLLQGIVSNPDQKISELPILTEEEKHKILIEWNDTKADYPKDKCIHQLFEEQAEKTPEQIAIREVFRKTDEADYFYKEITYKELNKRSNQLAHYLKKKGLKSEGMVGIFTDVCIERVIALLAVLKIGGCYIPLDPEYPEERIRHIITDSSIRIILTQEKMTNKIPENNGLMICLDTDWKNIEQDNTDNPLCNITPDNLIFIIYTSGSTGKPKGVMLTHRGYCNWTNTSISLFEIKPDSRVSQFASFSFDIGNGEIFIGLCSGATLYLGKHELMLPGEELIKFLRENKITVAFLPPSALSATPEASLPDLKVLFTGSDAFTVNIVKKWAKEKRFFNNYGPTETSLITNIKECFVHDERVFIGPPIKNTLTYILDKNLQPVPVGVPGEIHLSGVSLARGYLNSPELTAEKFISNPLSDDPNARLYKTGDLARYLPDGNIEFLGRIDHQVKIRGFRIELGEVEAVLGKHEQVKETIVTVREHTPGEKRLAAYIVPSEEKEPSISELREFLRKKLPDYMIPSAFVMLEKLPLTPNGKIDRKALPAPDLDLMREHEFTEPRNKTERIIAEIWKEVLNIEKVSVHDNFFEVGGNSLLTVRMVSRIEQKFSKTLSVAMIFESPTIEQLSIFLDSESKVPFTPLVKIQPQGKKTPIFLLHPGDGQIFCYSDLIKEFDKTQPFYGLQAYGIEKGTTPLDSIEKMASKYIETIRSVQPAGPYRIVGFCGIGGILVYETAQQLANAGEQITFAGIIDAMAPHFFLAITEVEIFIGFTRDFGALNGVNLLPLYCEARKIKINENSVVNRNFSKSNGRSEKKLKRFKKLVTDT